MKNIFPLIEQNISPQELLGPVLHQPWPPLSHFPPLMARTRTPWKLCSSWLPMVVNVLSPPLTLPAPSRSLTRESSAINQMNLRKTKRWVLLRSQLWSYYQVIPLLAWLTLWDEQLPAPHNTHSAPHNPHSASHNTLFASHNKHSAPHNTYFAPHNTHSASPNTHPSPGDTYPSPSNRQPAGVLTFSSVSRLTQPSPGLAWLGLGLCTSRHWLAGTGLGSILCTQPSAQPPIKKT